MPLFKNVSGTIVQMTAEEEAAFETMRRPTLTQLKDSLVESLKNKRRSIEQTGVTSGGLAIKTDTGTLTQLLAIKEAATPAQQVPVELANGRVVTTPAASLTGLITAVQARMLAVLLVEVAKRAEIDALATVAAAEAYNVNTGWPA